MTPSAPWNGTVSTLRKRGERAPHVGVLHEISEVFVSGKAEAGGGAVDHGVHRIGEGAPPQRDRDDDQDLDDLFGQRRRRTPSAAPVPSRDFRGSPNSAGERRARSARAARCWRRRARTPIQTCGGGPGRSSAAITSHRISSAGAIAAAPITVGRDSSSSISGSLVLAPSVKWPQNNEFASQSGHLHRLLNAGTVDLLSHRQDFSPFRRRADADPLTNCHTRAGGYPVHCGAPFNHLGDDDNKL